MARSDKYLQEQLEAAKQMVADLEVQLKLLAINCNFGNLQDNLIWDRMICGISQH